MKKWNGIVSIVCALIGIFISSKSKGQDPPEFKLLDKSEFVIFRLYFNKNHCEMHFVQVPENLVGSSLVFRNQTRDLFYSMEIQRDYKKQFSFVMGNQLMNRDTFLISVRNSYENNLTYHPTKLIVEDGKVQEIRIGENCYLLECVPQNDPWMPHVPQPYLFCKTAYYLNPKTGRILLGKRIIHSMLYEDCELQSFCWIDPNQLYSNKNGQTFKGFDLIKNKKIKTIEWNIQTFKMY